MKSIRHILVLASLVTSFSCTRVTDQVPESIITGINFYKTATDADNAINACYDALQGSPNNYEIWGDGRTDVLASTDRSASGDLQVASGNVSSSNSYVGWGALYSGINRCNGVLKHVPDITDPALTNRRDRIIGEAYFLRALFYFYLTRTFENVPLILEPYESLNADFYPRQSDRATIFAQIESDLKLAEPLIPDLPFASPLENKAKATKAAVRCVLADLYLWQKKYEQAAAMADLVINSPAKYTLVPGKDYATLFVAKNTSESILEIQYSNTYAEYTQQGAVNSIGELFLPLGGTVTGGNWRYQPSAAVLNLLPASDLRSSATYKNTGSKPEPYRDANKTYIAKYPGTISSNVMYLDANRIVYRLAEIILFKAEALNELGQTPEAISLLDQIRIRAGIGSTSASTQSEVRLAIENERLAELAFEGKRYYELIRRGRYAAVTGFTDPNWLRWPIAATEITKNTNLIQNTGY